MRRFCILIALAFLVSACGQKGPFYPRRKPKKHEPQKNRRRDHRVVSVFSFRNGELFAEDVPLSQIGEQFGTPCFVYSRAALEEAFRRYDRAFGDARASDLLCDEGQFESGDPESVRAPGQRIRHRIRR